MNKPKCPKGKLATMVCVTETCHRNAFMCSQCDDLVCQKGHQFCKTMLWSSALERINNYPKYESVELQEYIDRVDKIYDNILKKIRNERILFRENVQQLLYDSQYQKVKHHIEKQQYTKIEPRDIGLLITKMTSQTCNYEVQNFYINDMKQLDAQIKSTFLAIEKLCKKKLKIKEKNISKERPMTQSLILKRQQSKNHLNSTSRKQSQHSFRALTPRVDLSYPQHIDSKTIPNATVLNYLIGSKVKSYKLLYRASENGFQLQEFYKKCANSTPTVILIKTEHGKVIGGYTKLLWRRNQHLNDSFDSDEKEGSKYKEDIKGSTILFSVDLNEKYQLLQPKYAIYCGKNSIGFGKGDIRIVNHGHKHNKNYIGFPITFNNGLYLPVLKSSLVLSGSRHSNYFRLKQWQAFQVVFPSKK